MGTFERIRTLSPWILTAFAVVFILFMALADADIGGVTSATNNPQTMAIATVNGEEIKYIDYEKNVTQEVENQRNQNEDAPVNDKQIRNQMWNTMINGQIVAQYSKKTGAYVTEEVVAKELLSNPPDFMKQRFMDSAGTFQRQAYVDLLTDPAGYYNRIAPDMDPNERQEALAQFRNEINMITNYLRDQKKQQMLTNVVNTATGVVSKTYAKQSYIDNNSTANAMYIKFPAASVSDDDLNITDEDLKEFYDNHKERYRQEATRTIKYAAFRLQPSANDTASASKKVNLLSSLLVSADSSSKDSLFSEKLRDFNGETSDYTLIKDIEPRIAQYLTDINAGEIKGPIRASDGTYFVRLDDIRKGENKVVKASHILLSFDDGKDEALAKANDLLKQAKGGADFNDLARKNSQDPSAAQNGGDLGFFGKGQMVPAFEEAAFAANPGDIVGPVETQFGYHVIKVEDVKSEEYKYSFIKLTPKMSGISKNQIIRDAVSFKNQLEKGADIDELGEKLELNVQETAPFIKQRPTLTSQYLTDKAFNSELNTVLEPIEIENYGYVVAKVTGATAKGIAPFDAVKEKVRASVRTEKALEYQLAKANEVYNKIKGSGVITTAAEIDQSLQVLNAQNVSNNGAIPGGGKDYVFTDYVMNAPINKISGPFTGENAVYIVQVMSKETPSEEVVNNALPAYIQQLKANNQRNTYFLWLNQAKKDAEIEDMRHTQYKSY